MPTRTRTILLLALAAALALPLLADHVRDVVQLALEFGCVALAWSRLNAQRDLLDKGWGLIVAGVTTTALADTSGVLEVRVFHLSTLPRPSTIIVTAGYALLLLGAVVFDRRRVRVKRRAGGIDAAILGLGGLAPVLTFLVLPQLVVDTPLGDRLSVSTYALADLMIITLIARLTLTDSSRSRALVFLSFALVISLAGDFLAGVTSFQGSTSTSPLVEVLWTVGYVAFAAGIGSPDLRALTYGTFVDPARVAPRSQIWLLVIGLLLPGVSLAITLLLGDERYLWVLVLITIAVSSLVAIRVVMLIDQIGRQSEQLAQMARSDELTGLPNRRSWNNELVRAAAVAERSREVLSVALLDLDHFKAFNDTFGHPAGDVLLREAAETWSAALRPGEVLARYGGEEFAMLLPGLDDGEAAIRVEEIRTLLPGAQTASAGVAQWQPGSDPVTALSEADAALYLAKRQGRDRTVRANASGANGWLADLSQGTAPDLSGSR